MNFIVDNKANSPNPLDWGCAPGVVVTASFTRSSHPFMAIPKK